MATTDRHTGGGLNSSSGGELKLYLKGKRNTNVLDLSRYIYKKKAFQLEDNCPLADRTDRHDRKHYLPTTSLTAIRIEWKMRRSDGKAKHLCKKAVFIILHALFQRTNTTEEQDEV